MNLVRKDLLAESHKEGPVYGRIPYDPTSSEVDFEYPFWRKGRKNERKKENAKK